jgi:hypothetical protein
MLACTASAVPLPWRASMALATSAQASSLREEITTRAPCSAMRSAMARPMPREEPVITATFPSSENKDMGRLRSLGPDWAPRMLACRLVPWHRC